jgi:hypothetical protein
MAGLDLTTCTAKLTEYLAAETAVLAGQRVVIDGTQLDRADLAAIQAGVAIWNARVQRFSRSGMAIREIIPR